MLYFRALERGLSELPTADAAVRARIDADAAEHGWPALHERLADIDPVAAQRIKPQDGQRIQRALEVYELTGVAISELQNRNVGALTEKPIKLILEPADRAELNEQIEARFNAMLDAGFVDEVRRLHSRGDLTDRHSAMRAVGYRQIWAFLEGRIDLEEATRQAIVATRRLAKRQLTWLRGESEAIWLKSDARDLIERAEAAIRDGQAGNSQGAVVDSFT